ncbi:nudC domain-containing protein 3 [Rhinatrema bivittatum]|uniref:nudC domain-containing protein 3 n=1 Tax=Rhinatrema bivittatum TaxID=194408 RepID=UPI00112EC843|nr:nudC domain-containing protein 3 [Rhinatrema bivittatum]XP_029460085.1 nudC domain-containing protein 3 [Rhinatrema bivittatum]
MDLAMTERYDQALLAILQHVGNIQDFLHIYFGFLYRKTDFFRLLLSEHDRMGFPPGVAQNMVLKAFKTYEKLALQDHERRMKELEEKVKKEEEKAAERLRVPPPAGEVEIDLVTEQVPAAEEPQQATGQQQTAATEPEKEAAVGSLEIKPAGSSAAAVAAGQEQLHGMPRGQEQFQTNSDSYNGAVRDNYVWSQDYTDLEIKVPVPKEIRKGREVSVDLHTDSIRVAVREGNDERVLMEGKLTRKINTETSLWSLEPGKCVLINLSKNGEYWWNAILEGEEQIDIDKITKERSMAAMDEDEHAVLDRLTFDYHQKLQGKPQSHELKVHDMLKKGWDTEGSPFRGQKFDPSMFNISPGAVQF